MLRHPTKANHSKKQGKLPNPLVFQPKTRKTGFQTDLCKELLCKEEINLKQAVKAIETVSESAVNVPE